MKTKIAAAFIIGCVVGVIGATVVRTKVGQLDSSNIVSAFTKGLPTAQNAGDPVANNQALGQLYPETIALRIMTDMRVIDQLQRNGATTAIELLTQDLNAGISSLSVLKSTVRVSEFDNKALTDGRRFLAELEDGRSPATK